MIYEKDMSIDLQTKHIFGPNGHVAKVTGGTTIFY